MKQDNSVTPRELWSRQRISDLDVDYVEWEKKRESLIEFSELSGSCVFTVDVFMERYDYASSAFAALLGYDPLKINNIRENGDFLEERIHPDDKKQLEKFQIEHGLFIYSLPPEQRNDYRQIFQFRIVNAEGIYVNVVSVHQVVETDRNGKAWIVMGIMNISPDQREAKKVQRTVIHMKTGKIILSGLPSEKMQLTDRELEITMLMGKGLMSKEIADKLGISINTVNNHRKNIFAKLHADNVVEAVNAARFYGIVF